MVAALVGCGDISPGPFGAPAGKDDGDRVATGAPVLFLNFDGVTLSPGPSDATRNTVPSIVPRTSFYEPTTFPPFEHHFTSLQAKSRDEVIAGISAKVATLFWPLGVQVVTVRPVSGPYTMAVITSGTRNFAPLDCHNLWPNEVAFVSPGLDSDALHVERFIANLIAHEVGHTYGLQHIDQAYAIMRPVENGANPMDVDWGVGQVSGHDFYCSGPRQDSRETLAQNLAPRPPTGVGFAATCEGSPGSACGDIDFAGCCAGTTLKYCVGGMLHLKHCVSACGWKDTRHDCIKDPQAGVGSAATCDGMPGAACGDIDFSGCCAGSTLKYCARGVLKVQYCTGTCGRGGEHFVGCITE